MENVPAYVTIVFVLTTVLSLLLFCAATRWSRWALIGSVAWLAITGVLAWVGFYAGAPAAMPPRMMLALAPTLVLLVALLATAAGRRWLGGLSLRTLAWLHVVRVPVEIVLLWLSLVQVLPGMLTFEGRNYDIVSGLTAPLIAWLGWRGGKPRRGFLIAWNLICLALLVNIVGHAILTLPTPLQVFALDRPNIAVMYFPYIWLPSYIVPVVLYAHVVTLWRLWRKESPALG